MNAKQVIEQAKALIKAAQEDPKQFQELTKTFAGDLSLSEKAPAANGGQAMKKDDMAHAPNSPQDKAHDVSEDTDSVAHALKILDTPEKQAAMLAHLRTLCEPSQERSQENKEAGMAEGENKMDKDQMLKAAKELLNLAKTEPAKFEEMAKGMAAPAPAPAAPKAAMKPAAPAKPAGMRMTKDEIKADMAKPWEPKHKKAGC